MKMKYKYQFSINIAMLVIAITYGQNPIIRDQFSVDASARVFGDRVYLFPSHDILMIQRQIRFSNKANKLIHILQ